MKIGLVRHFKVKKDYPVKKIVTMSELIKWFEDYDKADIEIGTIDLSIDEWHECYSSDLYRAETTAKYIFSGDINTTELLREVKIYPLFKGNIRLPFFLWAVIIRLAWLLNHKSQLESKEEVINRISDVLDEIVQSNKNVLIVSHGALMIFIRKELIKRGFKGPSLGSPKNGKLYVFSNNKIDKKG